MLSNSCTGNWRTQNGVGWSEQIVSHRKWSRSPLGGKTAIKSDVILIFPVEHYEGETINCSPLLN